MKVIAATALNQWNSSTSVIEFFKNIRDKPAHSFISFDVVDFYPSITEDLLIKALSFASEYDRITDKEKNIIIQAKNSLLFNENNAWQKKAEGSNFDVTSGSFDGAETCELVGSYLLSQLPTNIKRNAGLYRDDGLGAFSATPKEIENIKKAICKTFNDHKLKLTIDANKKSVNFLDVSFDLRSGAYKPYTKPNSVPLYVHRDSNHPPPILRQIPESINRRLSNISSCQQTFDSTRQPYQEALLKSGYDYQLHFDPQPTQEKRSRKRNVIWFNTPCSANVATNIGRKFLKAIDDCFPKGHPLPNGLFSRPP